MSLLQPKRIRRKLRLIYSFRPAKRDTNEDSDLPSQLTLHSQSRLNVCDNHLPSELRNKTVDAGICDHANEPAITSHRIAPAENQDFHSKIFQQTVVNDELPCSSKSYSDNANNFEDFSSATELHHSNEIPIRDAKCSSLALTYNENQWSPTNPQGKRKYDRDFILKLKESPLSQIKHPAIPSCLDIHYNRSVKKDPKATLQSLLDNLTSENIGSLKPIIESLPILHDDQMLHVINQVFAKAAGQHTMCATYAEVCRLLSHIVVKDRVKLTKRKCMPLIVEQCNSEFNSYKKYRAQQSHDLRGGGLGNSNESERHFQDSQEVQQTFLGKVLLFGELYNVHLATAYFIRQWINELLNTRDEKSLLCLCRLLKIVGKNMENQKPTCLEGFFQIIRELVNSGKTAQISADVCLKLQEVIELRHNGWLSLDEINTEECNMDVEDDFEDKENLSQPRNSDPISTLTPKRRKSNEGRVIPCLDMGGDPCPDLLTTHVTCEPIVQKTMTQFQAMDIDIEMKMRDVLIEKSAATEVGYKCTNAEDVDAIETDDQDVQDLHAHVLHLLKQLDADHSEGLNFEIQSLPIDTNEDMKLIVNLLYDWAMKEPSSSLSCARMMRALGGVPDARDMIYGNYEHQLRLLVAERCCTQLTENTQLESKRDAKLKAIWAEQDSEKKQQLLKKCIDEERRCRKVFAAFIGFSVQLFKLKMLSAVMINRCIRHLMSSGDGTSLECLCELFLDIGSELESRYRTDLGEYFARLEVIAKFHSDRSVSDHLRALILHVIQLRQGKWKK